MNTNALISSHAVPGFVQGVQTFLHVWCCIAKSLLVELVDPQQTEREASLVR